MELPEVLRSIDDSREDTISVMCEIPIPSMSPAVGGKGEFERADFLQRFFKDFDTVQRFGCRAPWHNEV